MATPRTHGYLSNANLTLRLISVWWDPRTDRLESSDQAIIGWVVTDDGIVALPAGGPLDERVVGRYIYDRETKTWTGPGGTTYTVWADVVAPFYAQRDHDHPPPKAKTVWPLDAPKPQPGPPVIGRPRPTSGPRAAAPPHPRDDPDKGYP